MGRYVITGANRGIGLELCRQLAARGEQIVGVCRSASDELRALGVEVEEGVDAASAESIDGLARRLESTEIDCLINNAGIMVRMGLDDLDFEAIRRQFEVNSIGPLRMTAALLPRMSAGAKVGIVTSLMGSMADNGSGGSYGYRMSKAAVNAAGVSLAQDLRSRGVFVAILHPGMVQTEMTGHRGIPVAESAAGLIERLDGLDSSNSGTFWHSDGRELPW